ncbi:MAG: tetratricopeptide repeat protein [Undibacterium sp.]|uniref:tetratricopeptide repeat protein n=1 Tax=Undibacterium sp. TaxID=1914977 RepID=UPI0027288A0D|nr:tetratricopeptide repeat protein [Undibacterium sp.]MDO8653798.1 tetratricopeptide repeat protein [Undibacterium sp.]
MADEINAAPVSAETALQQAVIHHNAGELKEAEELYRSILQTLPLHSDANHNLGVIAVQVKQVAAGLPHFKVALEANPSVAQYWLSYIDALIQCGQTKMAREVLAQGQRRGLQGDVIKPLLMKLAAMQNATTSTAVELPIQQNFSISSDLNAGPNIQEMDTLLALYHQDRQAELENLARKLVEKFPHHGFGWKMLGATLLHQGRSIEAIEPMQKAAVLIADADSYYNLGVAFQGLYQSNEAEVSYRQALKINPEYADALSNLGTILKDKGLLVDAAVCYRQALKIKPAFADGHSNLGNILKEQGLPKEAEASYRRALEIRPDFAEAHSNLGIVLKEQGLFSEAEASYRRALEIKPDFTDGHCNLGATLQEQGRFLEAEISYRRALEISPNSAEVHFNLGVVLQNLRHYVDAMASYRKALELMPSLVKASGNLAATLNILNRFSEAEIICKRALEFDFNYAEVHNNLAIAFKGLHRMSEAEASCRQALQVKPDFAAAHSNLGNILQNQGRNTEAELSYRRALEIQSDLQIAFDNLLFTQLFQPKKTAEEIAIECRKYDSQFCLPHLKMLSPHLNNNDPSKRLKIGYVSADFRTHAVATFIEPVLINHDKTAFEVFCYYNHALTDDVTERFQAHVDHWLDCSGLNDDQLADRIRSDGIDLLIDLSGHTAGNRLLTFARKPAPVQLTYLGYPGSSGLTAMDYRITDSYADVQDSSQYYSENLLRLPDSLWCYHPAADMPEVSSLPALKNGFLTFGSFNNTNKVDQDSIDLWALLLLSIPKSRLLMVTVPEGARRQWLVQQFATLGIGEDRLDFQGSLPAHDFHQMFHRVDLTLDPMNVNGATTTCESLWMGVPVMTLAGNRFLSRAGFSILSACAMEEFAASSPELFIQIAQKLAADIPQLAQLRAGIRAQLAASALMDQARFTHNFEIALRGAWKKWCSSM